jgi:hypothetical protein
MAGFWRRLGLGRASRVPLFTVTIRSDDGSDLTMSLPPPLGGRESILYFSLPKGGTTLLNGAMQGLARSVDLVHVDIPGNFFRLGVSAPPSTADLFVPRGYVYGFPYFPTEYLIPLLGRTKSVVMVRDPRDMLVSLYYSLRSSHADPQGLEPERHGHRRWREGRQNAQAMSIDEHVMESAPVFAVLFAKQLELAAMPGASVYRYEDVVYRKDEWLADMCRHLGWPVSRRRCLKIAQSLDVFPSEERPGHHIRQVHPGNHKVKLKPDTIAHLNEIFSEALARFRYV